MKQIGIFYGSSTGNTEAAATTIASALGMESVTLHDISETEPDALLSYDNLILGASTWGFGELQDDWQNFLPGIAELDLGGKTVALFGLGDQYSYSDVFLDAMGIIYEEVRARGAEIVGAWPTDGYEFDGSRAIADGSFVGLALDADNQDDLTPERINQWISQLKPAFQ
ncbi:flavodoxin [Prosthecochloris sp. N3]|uniref:Flavodoxin n=1 Tax=Prosthecochloris ethylica TaxID=2743976 RepID=A0ABR9XQA9_9CHLB|nr:flavodoxin [Prosthecochloris ethylica]MBF0586464.1 flavodoxin [Prosthecochloris ethylica]MBF0636077.1 flavodoxin [Prosthecochloris ethylica]NUK47786.1 flavodoxin [Prosthecochloris ethylica]